MKFSVEARSLQTLKTPCLVVSRKQAQRVAVEAGARPLFEAALRDFHDRVGRTALVQLPGAADVPRLLVVGGADDELTAANFRKIVDAAARALRGIAVPKAVWALAAARVPGQDFEWRAGTSLAALAQHLYAFNEHKSRVDESANAFPTAVALLADERSKVTAQAAVRRANALKAGLDFARNLGNQPPNVCDPAYLLKEARTLARLDNVSVTSLSEKRMEELGMGAFMAVSRGSDKPGYLIIARYDGGKRGAAPTVLIGKGITFDTGGISLKPGPAMDEMKFDMCGAASVLGALQAAALAKLPINLIALVAAAENMPSGCATRPGDIVRTMSGKTVEILNTDAEGRLVLCDAMTWAEQYSPRAVIDVATLTGAIITALGSHASGLFANNDALADDLLAAGEWTGDRAWRMPLWDEYQDALKSNFADIPNIGTPGAASITAACFLARFADKYPWAHLDVAGTAFHGGPAKGASGRPVRLLFQYLCHVAGQ
ncbi:MAG: leucyl aminopeptidase [Pseudomonadota bacterium]|jgi:leucyl aminopeptidase